jgi:hypothetical protein
MRRLNMRQLIGSRRRLVVAAMIAVAALGVGLSALFSGSPVVAPSATTSTPAVAAQVRVPTVVGQTPAQAAATLTGAGLRTTVRTKQIISHFWTVVAQCPAGGSVIARNRVVTLLVSNLSTASTSHSCPVR